MRDRLISSWRPGMVIILKARIGNKLARHLRATPAELHNTARWSASPSTMRRSARPRAAPRCSRNTTRAATFYVAGGLVDSWSGNWTGVSADDIVDLHRRGHEIACHTFSHARATDLTEAAMAAELEQNRGYLLGAGFLDQDREFRLSLRHRLGAAQRPARRSCSVPRAASCRASTAAPWTCNICAPVPLIDRADRPRRDRSRLRRGRRPATAG